MKSFRIDMKIALLVGLVLFLLVVSLALAGGGQASRSLLAGGGSQVSNGALTLSSALGQPVAGAGETGNLVGAHGFWVGAGVQPIPTPIPGSDHFIYLPIVVR